MTYINFIISIIVILTIVFIYSLYPINNIIYVLSNFVIILISIWGMFSDENRYFSLKKMFFIFNFYMYGLVAYLETYYHVSYWGVDFLTINDYIFSNIIIILAELVFILTYEIIKKTKIEKNFRGEIIFRNYQLKSLIRKKFFIINLFLHIIFFINVFLIIIFIKDEWIRLFVRSGPAFGGQIIFLFYNYVLKPMPIIVFMIIYSINCIYEKCDIKKRVYLFILFIIAVIFMFPTSTARFLAISLYLALGLLIFKSLKKKYFFQFGSLIGVFIVFPFLDKFRHFNENKFTWKIDFHFLFAGHFDAYQNLTVVLNKDIVTYGHQLLGSLFFFIPRSVWMDKPIGSGAYIAHLLGYTFDNISMPYIAEGFINFSIIGVVFFMAFMGFLCAFFDNIYWELKQKNAFNFFYIFYYLFLGLLLFVLRGDLMSSFAYSFTILITYLIIIKIIIFLVKIKKI